MTRLPTLFVSHGAPTIMIEDGPGRRFLAELGRRYEAEHGRPRAILCITAHWDTDRPAVGAARQAETIHDFYGFPPELYRLRYPAPGAPDLAVEAAALMRQAGLDAVVDPGAGLDHGVWVPLMLMWPDADIPVVPMAVQPGQSPAHHRATGLALAPLAERGVLIIGSGGATHNLRDVMVRRQRGDDGTPPWAVAFEQWMQDHLISGDAAALDDYRRQAPGAVQAHPQDEHLLPVFTAFGAAGTGARATPLYRGFELGSLSLAAWQFAA